MLASFAFFSQAVIWWLTCEHSIDRVEIVEMQRKWPSDNKKNDKRKMMHYFCSRVRQKVEMLQTKKISVRFLCVLLSCWIWNLLEDGTLLSTSQWSHLEEDNLWQLPIQQSMPQLHFHGHFINTNFNFDGFGCFASLELISDVHICIKWEAKDVLDEKQKDA